MISWSDKMFQTAPSAFFCLLQVLLSTVHRHQGSPCRLCYFLKGPWTLGPASDETLPETVPTAQHYQLQSILTAMALLVGNAKRHGWPKRPSARLMTYEACLFCAGPGWPLLHHQDIHQCDLSSSRSSHRASMRKNDWTATASYQSGTDWTWLILYEALMSESEWQTWRNQMHHASAVNSLNWIYVI